MKKILFPMLVGFASLLSLPSLAQSTATDDFTVTVNLTPVCQLSTPPGDITLSYTSFAPGTVNADTSFAVRCTNNWPYTVKLNAYEADSLGLTIPLTILNAAGDTTIADTDTQVAGSSPTSFIIRASVTGPQQGTCLAAPCTATVTRTLTITY